MSTDTLWIAANLALVLKLYVLGFAETWPQEYWNEGILYQRFLNC